MSVLIVGAAGNMGARYRAILEYLGEDFVGVDREHSFLETARLAERASHILITTPTHTHAHLIEKLSIFGKPIKCEKPIVKDAQEVARLYDVTAKNGSNLSMVYQYKELVHPDEVGWSSYDYFKHGGDGLAWDCIQILGLAKGEVLLNETSPIWKCTINDRDLSIADMDTAYVQMVGNWLDGADQDASEIIAAHSRASEWERKLNGTD